MDKQSQLKENVFAWYQFKENTSAVLFSEDKAYEDILRAKVKLVLPEESFDYAIFIGEEAILEKIEKMKNSFHENTQIIVIDNNPLSIQELSNYPSNRELLKHSKKVSIATLKEKMKEFGFTKSETYYAFPNYQFVDMLFYKNYAIHAEQMQKYIPTIKETEIKILDEVDFLRKVATFDKNTLDIFANSYFIEFSKQEIEHNINFVSFNNTRKEAYRLMTTIREDVVEKVAVKDKAQPHLENMKKNIAVLKNENIQLLDYVQNDACYSKLIQNQQTLDMILAEHFEDLDFITQKFLQLKTILLKNAINYTDEVQNSLEKYAIDQTKIKHLNFLQNAWIDLIPKNCFLLDNEMYFFDQEWKQEFLPVDFVIYRGIINCYDLVKKIDVNKLYEKLNLTEYIPTFEKINQIIMNDILDQDLYNQLLAKTQQTMKQVIEQKNMYEKQIEDFKTEDIQKTKVIKALEDENLKKENVIQDLQNEEKSKAEYIKLLENIKTQKEQEIEQFHHMNQEKDEIINQLNQIINVKDHQISVYENMKIVKLTKKLRGNKNEA